jgi:hypothetical protein
VLKEKEILVVENILQNNAFPLKTTKQKHAKIT